MSNFQIKETFIKDLMEGETISRKDERGYFERVFCINEFNEMINFSKNIIQINRSLSKTKGTIRGCHFQLPPFAEIKIVFCTRGSLFDVGVDLRKSSPTYLKYYSQKLNESDMSIINKMINKLSIKEIVEVVSHNKDISKKEIYSYCWKIKNEI